AGTPARSAGAARRQQGRVPRCRQPRPLRHRRASDGSLPRRRRRDHRRRARFHLDRAGDAMKARLLGCALALALLAAAAGWAQLVLESETERARKELGKKAAKRYEDAYAALGANDCAAATKNAHELLDLGAGSWEYAVRFVLARCHAMQNELDAAATEYRKVV